MTTAIVHHPIYQKHDTGPGHPESPMRYEVVMNALRGDGKLFDVHTSSSFFCLEADILCWLMVKVIALLKILYGA